MKEYIDYYFIKMCFFLGRVHIPFFIINRVTALVRKKVIRKHTLFYFPLELLINARLLITPVQ